MTEQRFNLTDQTNLFKINYYKKSENVYNSENVLEGRIKKKYDFTGKRKEVSVPFSFSGGVGAGYIPTANAADYQLAQITAKKVYARARIEREAIKASANDEGAFVRGTAESVKKAVESYMRNNSRMLWGTGGEGADGSLGAIDVSGGAFVVAGTAAAPQITISTASWKESNWEEKDLVNITANHNLSNLYEVTTVTPSTKVVTLTRLTGSLDLSTSGGVVAAIGAAAAAGAAKFYMQRSYGKEPTGLKGLLDLSIAGSGSAYGISIGRKWSMTYVNAASAGVTTDRMNNIMLEVERKSGKVPNMIVCGYVQFRKILALLEDQKVYNLPNRNVKGNLSFSGVEFMSTKGPIGIFVDRFVDDDAVWFLNDNFIERHHRPDFGWFDDDGTVFLRMDGEDDYEARYGGYFENYIMLPFHGCLYGLAT